MYPLREPLFCRTCSSSHSGGYHSSVSQGAGRSKDDDGEYCSGYFVYGFYRAQEPLDHLDATAVGIKQYHTLPFKGSSGRQQAAAKDIGEALVQVCE
jgi:hypothetical protein